MSATTPRRIAVGIGAALIALVTSAGVDRLPARVRSHLERTNFRGETVSLGEGVAAVAGHVVAARAALGPTGSAAHALVGAVGLVDDIVEPLVTAEGQRPAKGLRGHLGALARGQVTTGNVKILGIALASAALAAQAGTRRRADADADAVADAVSRGGASGSLGALATWAADTTLIASSANLINLLDLRPGRALKATAILGAGIDLAARAHAADGKARAAGQILGSAQHGIILALAPRDLGARGMLGDAGANVLGAGLGARAALGLGPRARLLLTCSIVALTLASEKVSFSAVISSTPVLRVIDEWGRRP